MLHELKETIEQSNLNLEALQIKICSYPRFGSAEQIFYEVMVLEFNKLIPQVKVLYDTRIWQKL